MKGSLVCLTCEKSQPIEGGLHDDEAKVLQCKTCILKELRCQDCEVLTVDDKRILFEEGKGVYWALCQTCLYKSHTLLILLKDQSPESIHRLVNEEFKLADKLLDEEIAEEQSERAQIRIPRPEPIFETTPKERKSIEGACDLILGVQVETLIVGGRDECQEHLKFQTCDYNYEFQIGCHDAFCGYIDVMSQDASFVIWFLRHNAKNNNRTEEDMEIEMSWGGRTHKKIPNWIPVINMYRHITRIIKQLQIKSCKKWH